MEIQPPEHGIHDWRQFLVHMGTVVLGILIAIGLEQTVESLHHSQQRRELKESLRAEGIRNLHIALDNANASLGLSRAAAQEAREFRLMMTKSGNTCCSPTPRIVDSYVKPAYSAWTVAQQAGRAELLPRQEAQRYVRLYSLVQTASDELKEGNTAVYDVQKSCTTDPAVFTGSGVINESFDSPFDLRASDFSQSTAEDLRDCHNSLVAASVSFSTFLLQNLFLYGVDWAVLHDVSEEEALRVMWDVSVVYSHGGQAAVLAKYPFPEGGG